MFHFPFFHRFRSRACPSKQIGMAAIRSAPPGLHGATFIFCFSCFRFELMLHLERLEGSGWTVWHFRWRKWKEACRLGARRTRIWDAFAATVNGSLLLLVRFFIRFASKFVGVWLLSKNKKKKPFLIEIYTPEYIHRVLVQVRINCPPCMFIPFCLIYMDCRIGDAFSPANRYECKDHW